MPPTALTDLAEDERLFFNAVLEFARREIAPHVRQMDEQATIPRSLLAGLTGLGVMGIEVPEPLGGGGATFFHAVLAVEALAHVDAAVAVLVDVQNTLVINAILRWGSEAIRTGARGRGRRRLCAVGGGLGQRRIRTADPCRRERRRVSGHGPEALDHQRRRG